MMRPEEWQRAIDSIARDWIAGHHEAAADATMALAWDCAAAFPRRSDGHDVFLAYCIQIEQQVCAQLGDYMRHIMRSKMRSKARQREHAASVLVS